MSRIGPPNPHCGQCGELRSEYRGQLICRYCRRKRARERYHLHKADRGIQDKKVAQVPPCQCGCGSPTKIYRRRSDKSITGYAKYADGHRPGLVKDGQRCCPCCGQWLDFDAFYRSTHHRGGPKVPRGWCKQCHSIRQKRLREESSDRVAMYRRWLRYRLTEEQFTAMVASCDGLCHLCKRRNGESIDHCHETGRVRGYLCSPCNRALGLLGDNENGLQRALDYVKRETDFGAS